MLNVIDVTKLERHHSSWYPFDTNVCYIDIKLFSSLEEFVVMIPDEFEYQGPIDLTEYTIREMSMDVIKDGTLRIVISIHRRILSLFLTTFLPTMLLPVMGHVTNYFNDSFFEGKMAVNVTVMLMLTTMFLR